jgi:hypothetical protein
MREKAWIGVRRNFCLNEDGGRDRFESMNEFHCVSLFSGIVVIDDFGVGKLFEMP